MIRNSVFYRTRLVAASTHPVKDFTYVWSRFPIHNEELFLRLTDHFTKKIHFRLRHILKLGERV